MICKKNFEMQAPKFVKRDNQIKPSENGGNSRKT